MFLMLSFTFKFLCHVFYKLCGGCVQVKVRNKEDKSKKMQKVNMIRAYECVVVLCCFIFGMSCFSLHVYSCNIHCLLTKQGDYVIVDVV